MMDWSTIINLITLLTVGGGLYALATIQDKRMTLMLENIKSMLDNTTKVNDAWERIAKTKADVLEILEKRCDNKDKDISVLQRDNSVIRRQLDRTRTAKATAEMLRCNNISCTKRIPPFGKITQILEVDEDVDENN